MTAALAEQSIINEEQTLFQNYDWNVLTESPGEPVVGLAWPEAKEVMLGKKSTWVEEPPPAPMDRKTVALPRTLEKKKVLRHWQHKLGQVMNLCCVLLHLYFDDFAPNFEAVDSYNCMFLPKYDSDWWTSWCPTEVEVKDWGSYIRNEGSSSEKTLPRIPLSVAFQPCQAIHDLHRHKSLQLAFWPGKSPILFGNSEDVTYLKFGLVTPLIQDILRSHFSGLLDSQIRDPRSGPKWFWWLPRQQMWMWSFRRPWRAG